MTYRKAGVDLNAADVFEEMIRERIEAAWPGGGEEIGKFAGGGPVPCGARRIVAGTDGTGTKIILAAMADELDGIGQDAVAMAAVDVYAAGSNPVYLLNTLKVARLDPARHIRVIDSVIRGCLLAGCQLCGGETAELPSLLRHPWMIDLDATAIGFPASRGAYLPVKEGQRVYGWPSYGLGSNGFSLARLVFGLQQPRIGRRKLRHYYASLGETLDKALLRPTPIWIREIEAQRERGVRFAGLAHITGGGVLGNIPRILPPHCKAIIHRGAWRRPPIFSLMQRKGYIAGEEMDKVFNNGIILVAIVNEEGGDIADEHALCIGEIVKHMHADEPQVELTGSYRDE